MREWINIVLNEAKVSRINVMGSEVRVWANPSHREFEQLLREHGSLRGTLDKSGHLFVWDPAIAIHSSVEQELGIAAWHRMMMKSSEVALEYDVSEEDLKQIPAMQRAYGEWDFDVMNDSATDDEDEELEEAHEAKKPPNTTQKFEGIVYHGSPNRITSMRIDPARGAYFSSDVGYAQDYGENVYKCKVVLNNPRVYSEDEANSDMEIDRKALLAQGFDGRIVKYDNGNMDVVVFDRKQIKKMDPLLMDHKVDFDTLRKFYENRKVIDIFSKCAGQCTSQAQLILSLEGTSAQMFGFSNENNPGTIVDDPDEPDEGHHFVVVNGRYITDPWMYDAYINYPKTVGRAVFDLKSPRDAAIIKQLYGDQTKWVKLSMEPDHSVPEELRKLRFSK